MSYQPQPQPQAGHPSSFAPSTRQAHSPAPAAGLPQYGAAAPPVVVNVPPGTLPPGTIVRIGEYQVRVERFLSEGGFAHVYLATSATPIPVGSPSATTKHVLKRIAVPDKRGVEEVGKEVEVMKLVRNHPRIVNMIEASVSELPGGVNGSKGYEIYILMEWCAGGGIIDMMNTRLQNRLTETEILKIFSDTVEAVAHMHYQNPPLIHRDLKVENILLSPPQTYKLCDFGSTTTPLPREKVPTAVEAIQKMELEINKTTTLQYRAPELVDVWGRKGFDEKIDIWALGVLLYKLCYYTTPFEEHGPLAILNAQYKIPPYPAYSNSIKGLIGAMLQESASQRPNIYQVHEQVCRLRGVAVRLENKYSSSSSTPSLPTGGKSSANPAYSNILSSGPVPTGPTAPSLAETISPMRRGRPTKGGLAPSSAETARMVKTGGEAPLADHAWQDMGGSSAGNGSGAGSVWPTGKSAPSTGSNGFGDAFSSKPVEGDGARSSPAMASFGDSFDPSSKGFTPSSSSVKSPTKGGAMFADLVPSTSSSSPKPGPMMPQGAGGLGEFGNEGWSGRSSSATAAPSAPPKAVAQEDDETAVFESTYPSLSLDDDLLPPSTSFTPTTKTSTPSSITANSFVPPSASPAPPQLTGEAAPPLPRRPVASETSLPTSPTPKPQLVSRSSQTSPHLLAGWKPPNVGTSSRLNRSEVAGPEESTRTKRQSVDLLGDDDGGSEGAFATKPFPSASYSRLPPPPTLPPLTDPVPASSSTSSNGNVAGKRMSFAGTGSWSGDVGREKFRPVKPTSDASAPPPPPSSTGVEATQRYPSIDLLDATPPPVSAVGVKDDDGWQPIVEKQDVDDESSDEEPEEFAPRRQAGNANGREARPLPQPPTSLQPAAQIINATLPPITRLDSMSSSEGGGDIDLGPALASIRKFAPVAEQPLAEQPPPPQAAKDDWSPPAAVSRSTFSSSPHQQRSPSSSSSAGPPLLAPKPQSTKLNNLVSRYETLSVEPPSSPVASTPTGGSSNSKRPPPPLKPTGMRRDSLSSSSSHTSGSSTATGTGTGTGRSNRPHWASKVASPQHFQQRYPDAGEGLDRHLSSSSASASGSGGAGGGPGAGERTPPARAPPFKPVGPTGTPKREEGVRKELPPAPAPAQQQGEKEEEEEEEKFAGVRNMKSRWESMGRGGAGSSGPGKAVGGRKEWGVV